MKSIVTGIFLAVTLMTFSVRAQAAPTYGVIATIDDGHFYSYDFARKQFVQMGPGVQISEAAPGGLKEAKAKSCTVSRYIASHVQTMKSEAGKSEMVCSGAACCN